MPDLAALRGALAAQAARRTLAGRLPGPVIPRLRLLTTAELLCPAPPPGRAVDAAAELAALCAAAGQMLRRRAGWLRADLCGPPAPVLARGALLQAAVLAWLRGALLAGGGDPRGDAAALLRRLAGEAGGGLLLTAGGAFGAALRLPAADGLPLCPAPCPGDLLADRYGLPRLYLDGFCAEPER